MENLKVLVVDDEPNIRDLLSASLRFQGHQVLTAANGNEAINKIVDNQPDVVLLDVMLPDISGFGVTKKIRSLGIETPILFLTARDDTEDKVTGLTVGGDDYVTKPFSLDEIIARISAIMRRTGKDHRISTASLLGNQPQPSANKGTNPGSCLGVRFQRRNGNCGILCFLPSKETRPNLYRATNCHQARSRLHAQGS